MNFSIIIPYYNGQKTIVKLLETIPPDIEVLLVDDLSTKKLPDLSKFTNLKIVRIPKKGYFTGAVNYGIERVESDVLVLNQDVYFVDTSWLDQLKKELDSGYSLLGERIAGDNPKFPKGYIHGTYMYITREVIDKIGLMDSKLFPMWGSTADYQTRAARAGFKVLPLTKVDGFVHLRPKGEGFGDSFKELLQTEKSRKSEFVLTPPLVSVVIPCYNFSKYLKDAVHSLVGGETSLGHFEQQTFSAFEVVIVDDSSTDNSPQVISELVDDYKCVRSIRLDRKDVLERGKYAGKVVALNEGIKSAWGKYIVVLDADDMMETDRLEQMFVAAESNPNHIIYDNAIIFNGSERKDRWTLSEYDFDKLIHKNIVHASIMFPKAAWKKIGGYPSRFRLGREDWAINVKFGEHGYCGKHIHSYGLLYRRHGGNRTLVNTRDEWMNFFREQMRQEYAHLYRGERTMACCGRGSKKSVVRYDGNRTTVINVAPEGSTLLLYNGNRTANFHVYGFITNLAYRVTPGVPFAADNRDLISDNPLKTPGLLDLLNEDYKTYKFVKYEFPEVPPSIEEEEPIQTLVETRAELDLSILDGNMLQVEAALTENTYTTEELNQLLGYEMIHKNRVGAKNLIEGLLHNETV